MRTWRPSKSTHTGVTCGLPSGPTVARCAKPFFSNRSLYFVRSAAMSLTPLDLVHHLVRVTHRLHRQRTAHQERDVERLRDFFLARPEAEDLLDPMIDSVEAVLRDGNGERHQLLVLL